MLVYIVVRASYDESGYMIAGVFTNEEDAEDCACHLQLPEYEYYAVHKCRVGNGISQG